MFWGFVGWILFWGHGAHASLQCHLVFHHQNPSSDHIFITRLLKSNPTDRHVVFAEHGKKTVSEFVDLVLLKKRNQLLKLQRTSIHSVSHEIYRHYLNLLEDAVEHAHSDALKIKNWEKDTREIYMHELIVPKEDLEPLRASVVSLMIKTNSVLAEFLAALTFPKVITTEKTIGQMIAGEPESRFREFRDSLGSEEWRQFLTKKMDLVSTEGDTLLWIEVKYLGRKKIYTSVSGTAVHKKLKHVKTLAKTLNKKIRILLVTVGPGVLAQEVIRSYNTEGVEVRTLTPFW
jgi:hypothetical protein